MKLASLKNGRRDGALTDIVTALDEPLAEEEAEDELGMVLVRPGAIGAVRKQTAGGQLRPTSPPREG